MDSVVTNVFEHFARVGERFLEMIPQLWNDLNSPMFDYLVWAFSQGLGENGADIIESGFDKLAHLLANITPYSYDMIIDFTFFEFFICIGLIVVIVFAVVVFLLNVIDKIIPI